MELLFTFIHSSAGVVRSATTSLLTTAFWSKEITTTNCPFCFLQDSSSNFTNIPPFPSILVLNLSNSKRYQCFSLQELSFVRHYYSIHPTMPMVDVGRTNQQGEGILLWFVVYFVKRSDGDTWCHIWKEYCLLSHNENFICKVGSFLEESQ